LSCFQPANFCAPCSNPYSETAPNPPDVRTSWEPLPGFPADFQPPSSSFTEKRDAQGNSTGLPGRDLENPPYKIQAKYGTLWGWTVWPSAPNYGGYEQYDIHNLYASGMISHTRKGLLDRRPDERPFIISRSTFSGDGAQSGHWTGDNDSKWSHYLLSIVQHQEFASIFQIPMVGSDVCGFNQDTDVNLCARWAMLGAWYPFYRNHNANNAVAQEFYLWPLVTEAAKKAISTRFALLDYFYTAFYQQTVDGSPSTIIPLFFQYPNDTNTLDISYQFFYGPSILVSPVTIEDATNVTIYLPEDTFYDYWSGQRIIGNGTNITLTDIGYTDIPVHIRGGTILPLRTDADTVNTTAALRNKNFTLLIAPDNSGRAAGYLHLDDGKSLNSTSSDINFSYENGSLALGGTFGYSTDLQVISAKVLGDGSGATFNLTKSLNKPWVVNIYSSAL
jgi:alpha-glucosidase